MTSRQPIRSTLDCGGFRRLGPMFGNLGLDLDVLSTSRGTAHLGSRILAWDPRHASRKGRSAEIFLTVFERQTAEATFIFAQRLNSNGLPLDATVDLNTITVRTRIRLSLQRHTFSDRLGPSESDSFGNILDGFTENACAVGTPVERNSSLSWTA